MWEYSDKVKDHFFNPRNIGELEDANAVGEVGSLACGDALKLFLKIDPETEKIVDARFQTFGCGSAIASSSALTEMVKGRTVDEALKITNQDIAEYLGGLPQEKMHCSVMGRDAFHAAVACYRGQPAPSEELEGQLVCECFGVTDEQIRHEVKANNLTTVEQVTHYTKAGGGCGLCHEKIAGIIQQVRGERKQEPKTEKPAPRMTNLQKIAKIQDVIEKEIRPMLQQDGGDVELVDLDGNRVLVALRGMCTSCPSSSLTKGGIEAKLRELVHPDLFVEEVAA
ncbi:MAG: Fe-S cluster assembly protein NifU [Desulfomonile tiedjei]|uniref:Nitrogen fixation protein NifU n=1 Tax=Desulfomonile tiedjei TaxID=2358 RepID=A0A9D6V3I8_9BACT|nr:Fe-S cluster assembly protein NifU [Desulfomonile tiedjei]